MVTSVGWPLYHCMSTDMPDDAQMTALLSGSYINYFHCLAIVDLLKVNPPPCSLLTPITSRR